MSLPSSSTTSQLRTVRRLCIASVICASFVCIELAGGYISGSLAIYSDAAHLATDLFAYLVAMAASRLATKKPTKNYTWGFRRIESLAALLGVFSLIAVTLWLLIESVSRSIKIFLHLEKDKHDDDEQVVDGYIMSGTAALGVIVNVILACVLRENHVHLPGADCGHDHSLGGGSGFLCIHDIAVPVDEVEGGDIELMSQCAVCPVSVDKDEKKKDREEKPKTLEWGVPMGLPIKSKYEEGAKGEDVEAVLCCPVTITSEKEKIKEEKPKTLKFGVPMGLPMKPKYELISESAVNDNDDDDEEQFMNKNDETQGKGASQSIVNKKKTLFPIRDEAISELESQPLVKGTNVNSNTKTNTNVNLEAAYLHALTDLAQSAMVLITGCLIWWKPNWYFLDPILTFIFSLMVLWGSKSVINRSLSVLLEVKPSNLDYDKIYESILALPDVKIVCGLRIWSVCDGQVGLNTHINLDCATVNKNTHAVFLRKLVKTLKDQYGIEGQYVTVQVFQNDSDICPSCGINGGVWTV